MIKSTFKEFHNILNQREISLIKSLNDMANDKKQKLQNAAKILNQQQTQSQQVHLFYLILFIFYLFFFFCG